MRISSSSTILLLPLLSGQVVPPSLLLPLPPIAYTNVRSKRSLRISVRKTLTFALPWGHALSFKSGGGGGGAAGQCAWRRRRRWRKKENIEFHTEGGISPECFFVFLGTWVFFKKNPFRWRIFNFFLHFPVCVLRRKVNFSSTSPHARKGFLYVCVLISSPFLRRRLRTRRVFLPSSSFHNQIKIGGFVVGAFGGSGFEA